ncbi:MAG: acetate/propionate family kinase [Phycisphaerae bacterium]
MKVLVINCGSSSIKYELFAMPEERSLADGQLSPGGGDSRSAGFRHEDHAAGIARVLETLVEGEQPVLRNATDIDAVGHRVVHSGCDPLVAEVVNDRVLETIRRGAELAPLHNPRNLAGIQAARKALPEATQVAVFDTGFFTTIPEHAFRYAVPESWYKDHHVRKYGFHGLSHQYVALRATELLRRRPEETNLITVHLGGGCSMTAVEAGRAVDHSMGMTPMEGLMMGTRSGDLDPGAILYMQRLGFSPEQIDEALNFRSGLLAVSGATDDMRDVLAAAERGNRRAELAVDMFVYRVAKYIGAYYTVLPEVHAVVLTGGIGENSREIRSRVVLAIDRLGAVFDSAANDAAVGGKAAPVTAENSSLDVWVVPTNEELMIARQTAGALSASRR